ncbi:MAG: Uma2 family endonuclease [Saprospiraceae bacterium]|nr:Uma2 family endonuclease [Saprospiraceae bacterium]
MTATAIADSPIHEIIRLEPLVFKSRMSKEQFNRFVLRHTDLRIERDKHGTITIHPPMTFDSAYYEGEAFGILRNWSKTNSHGRTVSPSASFNLPDGSQHKADGAWISMEKINGMNEEERRSIAELVPDFVLEVLSETDSLAKAKKKMKEVWIENGVRLAWLIDPKKERAWIYRANGTSDTIEDFSNSLLGEDVLPGFVFNLWEIKG